ncbi:unnamed protein product [Dovyalis caffra]|uniref:Uncharacterized protein n=1 Tax=Dovyalis caffra TaxID=77055 RepID=A0AAV1S1G6_9ROSI|nr:unnamed protein product [Dovyalis caffra]
MIADPLKSHKYKSTGYNIDDVDESRNLRGSLGMDTDLENPSSTDKAADKGNWFRMMALMRGICASNLHSNLPLFKGLNALKSFKFECSEYANYNDAIGRLVDRNGMKKTLVTEASIIET